MNTLALNTTMTLPILQDSSAASAKDQPLDIQTIVEELKQATQPVGAPFLEDPKFYTREVDVFYNQVKQAIFGVDLDIGKNEVIAMIGPSGCGKSTFLRCLNRMNDTIDGCKVTGQLLLDGEDIYAKEQDPVLLRARVGMVFQKPNPFPKSIAENVAYGLKINNLCEKSEMASRVEQSLRDSFLWEESETVSKFHSSQWFLCLSQ